jgi:phosphoribosylglycinamide formyltransferase-1
MTLTSHARLVVLISGNGSNLQVLNDHIQAARLPAKIELVISNRADAHGLQRAANAQLAHLSLPSQGLTRQDYEKTLINILQEYQPNWIVLAGFMRILTAEFIHAFPGRIINIHPSLLPAYKGLNTHQRIIDDQQTRHGCSVHLVTAELDDGPLLAQAQLDVNYPIDANTLATQVHQLEYQLYPLTLFGLCTRQCYDVATQSWQPADSAQQPIFAQALTAYQLQQVFQRWLNH